MQSLLAVVPDLRKRNWCVLLIAPSIRPWLTYHTTNPTKRWGYITFWQPCESQYIQFFLDEVTVWVLNFSDSSTDIFINILCGRKYCLVFTLEIAYKPWKAKIMSGMLHNPQIYLNPAHSRLSVNAGKRKAKTSCWKKFEKLLKVFMFQRRITHLSK